MYILKNTSFTLLKNDKGLKLEGRVSKFDCNFWLFTDECNRTSDCGANAQCVFDNFDTRYVCECNPGFNSFLTNYNFQQFSLLKNPSYYHYKIFIFFYFHLQIQNRFDNYE